MATTVERLSDWMTLGEVSRALDINEGTLRQWADRGRLPVYRTPGGHRRFMRADVESLMQAPPTVGSSGPDPEDLALRRIRRKLGQMSPESQGWISGFQAEGRDRMRLFGRRLLSLLLQDGLSGRSRRKGETLSESHMLGHEYGAEMAARTVSLTDSVQAFLFFRQVVVESVPPDRLRQVVEISDRVLLGLVDGYEERIAAARGSVDREVKSY